MTIGEQNNNSTIVMQKRYTISFIENWKTEYVLPEETFQIIKYLNDTLQIVEDTSIPSSHITKQKYIDNKSGGGGGDYEKQIIRKGQNNYKNYGEKGSGIGAAGGSVSQWSKQIPQKQDSEEWNKVVLKPKPQIIEPGQSKSESQINKIRILFNKISNKNYETQKNIILEEIEVYFNECENEYNSAKLLSKKPVPDINTNTNTDNNQATNADINIITIIEDTQKYSSINLNNDYKKLTDVLFAIVKTNKFFCEIYSNVYKELINTKILSGTATATTTGTSDELTQQNNITELSWEESADIILNDNEKIILQDIENNKFKKFLYILIEEFKNSIEHIYYTDPNVDYDKYCVFIKENDIRKALAMFIVGLYKNGVLPKTDIFIILRLFIDKSCVYINEENRTNELEEISDNVFLLFTNLKEEEKTDDSYKNIVESLTDFSKMKVKECKSLTSRTVFKYQDIIKQVHHC